MLFTRVQGVGRKSGPLVAGFQRLDLKYYAAHIRTLLDAAAINVMRPKKSKNQDQTKVA
jgi:hypothetical protein